MYLEILSRINSINPSHSPRLFENDKISVINRMANIRNNHFKIRLYASA